MKERYPRFQDALADIDDALTLTFLFAALPADRGIPPKVASKAKTLAAAWGAYCATTCSITKSFISVKGVYIEALIQSIPVRWVIPHSFTQHPSDVDYRVMMTFFEFYETLLDFVLFKLYSDIGLRYPFPLKDVGCELVGSMSVILGANLRTLTNVLQSAGSVRNVVAEAVQKESVADKTASTPSSEDKRNTRQLPKNVDAATLRSIEAEDKVMDDKEEEDEVDVAGPLKVALDEIANERSRAIVPGSKVELDDDAVKRKQLLQGLVFFLSREVPRGYLELVCLSYGGKVGWEGENSLIAVDDPSITHHIIDRPKLASSYDALPKSREFVQPQWLLDCANFMFLLPIQRYAVGCSLPPHLSPWVDNDEEGYKPAYAEEIEKLKNGELVEENALHGKVSDTEGEANDREYADAEIDAVEQYDEAIESSHDDDEGEEPKEELEEEEEENDDAKKQKLAKKLDREQNEAHELAKTMMSRKAASLYSKMQHGLALKKEKVEALYRRRREIEDEQKDSNSGKTVLKQKVERLKKERKDIEHKYGDSGANRRKKRRSA